MMLKIKFCLKKVPAVQQDAHILITFEIINYSESNKPVFE